jgi:hypothetical protein
MKLNVWKQVNDLEVTINLMQHQLNALQELVESNNSIEAKEKAEREEQKKIKSAIYSRNYYQKKKAERQGAK